MQKLPNLHKINYKDNNATHYHSDVYLLQYKKHAQYVKPQQKQSADHNNMKNSINHSSNSKHSKFSMLQSYLEHSSRIQDHNKMPFITNNHHFNKIKNQSSASVFFKIITKFYLYQIQSHKIFAFSKIKQYTKSYLLYSKSKQSLLQASHNVSSQYQNTKYLIDHINLKSNPNDSLQMIANNQIQKKSKNFEIHELINIVNNHRPQQRESNQNEKSDVSIQKKLSINSLQNSKQSKSKSRSRTLSKDVYIIQYPSKHLISTKNDIKSLKIINNIKSEGELQNNSKEGRKKAFSIDKKKFVRQQQLREQPLGSTQRRNPTNAYIALDVIRNYQNKQVLNLNIETKQNNTILNQTRNMPKIKRQNRFMQNVNPNPTIYVNYQAEQQRNRSPSILSKPITHLVQNHLMNKQGQVKQNLGMKFKQHHHYYNNDPRNIKQEIRSVENHLNTQNAIKKVNFSPLKQYSLQRKRTYSLPKIKFTYLNKEQFEKINMNRGQQKIKHPQIIQQSRKTKSVPAALKERIFHKNNVYIRNPKNVIHPIQQQRIIKKTINQSPQGQILINKQLFNKKEIRNEVNNNYHLPVLPNVIPNFIHKDHNKQILKNDKKNVQLLGSLAIYQPKVTTIAMNFAAEYYGIQPKQTTATTKISGTRQQPIATQVYVKPDRYRIKSMDTYILRRPQAHPSTNKDIQNHIIRQKSRSCTSNLQVVYRNFKKK